MSSRPSSRNTNLRVDTPSPRSASSEQKSPISSRSPLSATRLPVRSRTPDSLTTYGGTERPSSISTQNLVVAANQLLQINAPSLQRIRAAHQLLALPEEDASPRVLKTVYQLLSSISDSEQQEFKASEPPGVSSTLPPNRINLHQHRNLPYFSLKPAEPESLLSVKLMERPLPAPVSQVLPSSMPRIQTRSKTLAHKQTQARLTRPGAVVGSRMASLHHPTAEVPRFISKQSSQNLTLDSSFATNNYIYTFIWTDPNTGEEVNISTSQVVNLQILIQTTTSNTNGTSNSFQFSIPVGSTSNPSVLFNGSPNTPTTNLSGWSVLGTSSSGTYSITASSSTALNSGTLLIVSVNSCTINSTAGVSLISITEHTGTTTNASIIKSPSYLILKDMYFTTTNNGSGAAVTAVTPGTSVYVSWIMYNPTATSASMVLYYNDTLGSTTSANVGTQGTGFTTYSSSIQINSDTLFTLMAQTPSGKTYQIQQMLRVTIPPQSIVRSDSFNSGANPAHFLATGVSNTSLQLIMGVNTSTNFGCVQAYQQGHGGLPLKLNPSGGAVTAGGNTLSDANGNASVTGTLTLPTTTGSFNLLPTGVIVAYHGTTVPAGWSLCNGQNGTPDLRGRFILGAQGTYAAGVIVNGTTITNGTTVMNLNDTGGEQLHTLVVNEIPSHAHDLGSQPGCQLGTDNGTAYATFGANNYNSNVTNFRTPTNTGSTGGSAAHNNLPPFYVLTYIMRM